MRLSFDQYQEAAARTINEAQPTQLQLANFGMGLAGEAGEVCDHLKKVVFHGHELDREALAKELGDALWYMAATASTVGLRLEDIAELNVEKLRLRYPEGFDPVRSQQRKD